MTLLSFKQQLYSNLESHYPISEITTFFQLILEDVLQLTKIDFALAPNTKISQNKTEQLQQIIKGLIVHTPIQYLIGFVTYMDLKLEVNKQVLIPRPETETLIRWILEDYKQTLNVSVLDIGTGSGCIPIALSKQLQQAKIAAIDVSKAALKVAAKNAEMNQTDILFHHQDILTTDKLPKTYDVIVSNPPYVRNLEKVEIKKNVLDYEPHLALFVEDNAPLIFYKKIAELAIQHLQPTGALYYEINQYLGNETVELLKEIGFKNVILKKDLFGNDRMIKATLR